MANIDLIKLTDAELTKLQGEFPTITSDAPNPANVLRNEIRAEWDRRNQASVRAKNSR